MSRLTAQVEALAHAYVRKGGKDNRRQQAARMVAFAAHAEAMGALDVGVIGKRHVVAYWRALRKAGRSERTQYGHWLAIRELWRLAGKPGEPPKPRYTDPVAGTAADPVGIGGVAAADLPPYSASA